MKLNKRIKYLGFSLMEILLAVFIVGVLALATAPIISKQMEKADEYSYFLAYKTVEKLGGQIVALGDPEEANNAAPVTSLLLPDGTKIANSKNNNNFLTYFNIKLKTNPFNKLVASIGDKFTQTEKFIISKFVSFAMAEERTTTITEYLGLWETDTYDELWLNYQVCANGKQIAKSSVTKINTTVDESGNEVKTEETSYNYYKDGDGVSCTGVTKADANTPENYAIYDSFFNSVDFENLCLGGALPESYDYKDLAEYIKKDGSEELKPCASCFFTEKLTPLCKGGQTIRFKGEDDVSIKITCVYESADGTSGGEEGEEDEQEEVDEEFLGEEGATVVETPYSDQQGSCTVETSKTVTYSLPEDTPFTPDRPEFTDAHCGPTFGYYNMKNDAKPSNIDCICKENYVVSMNNPKVCLPECGGTALPYAHTLNQSKVCCSTDFNPNTNKCCPEKSLYDSASGTCSCAAGYEMVSGSCVLKDCPKGSYRTTDGVCMVNPPIIKAKRFCEEIDKNWNTSNAKCDTFTDSSGFNTYSDVYNAIVGSNGNYMSVDAKEGAFNSIEPNIIFTNGLKLWILGDKSASIPALTYYDTTVTSTQNMCKKINLSSNTEAACKNAGGYFCKSENVCLAMDAQSTSKIGDARTCCGAPDMTSLQELAAANGDTVDWKSDARAYAVAGFTVLVDINGDKGSGTLWDDVYPFFVGSNGTVYPGYPLDGAKSATSASNMLYIGGNNSKQLPVDVYYYKSTDDTRERVVAYSSVSFARGVCSSRDLSKYAPYCLNLGEKSMYGDTYIQTNNSTCDTEHCYYSVRKKRFAF